MMLHKPLSRAKVLVVEDDPILAFYLMGSLSSAGAEIVGPAATVRRARELAEAAPISCAIIDLHLHDGLVFPLAHELRRKGVSKQLSIRRRRDLPRAGKEAATMLHNSWILLRKVVVVIAGAVGTTAITLAGRRFTAGWVDRGQHGAIVAIARREVSVLCKRLTISRMTPVRQNT